MASQPKEIDHKTFPQKLRRWLKMYGCVVLLAYLGIIALLMFFENKLLFFPSRAEEAWFSSESVNLHVEDVEVVSGDGTRLHAWWCPAKEPGSDTLLFLHGNGGNLSFTARQVALWQKHLGVSAFVIDYPGYGKSDGKPSEAGCYAAAHAAYNWVTQTKKIPAERVLICGQSLGGAVAVELASQKPHRALVLISTFTSVPDMAQQLYPFLPARWIVRNQFNSLAKIEHCQRPLFQSHGTSDSLIPYTQGTRLFGAAPGPKRFLSLEGFDHNDEPNADFYEGVKKFLAENDTMVSGR